LVKTGEIGGGHCVWLLNGTWVISPWIIYYSEQLVALINFYGGLLKYLADFQT
jgi:hypothetical protein